MGADAELFVFDYDRYVNELVPAILTWLKDGRISDWMNDKIRMRGLIDPSDLPLSELGDVDLRLYCTHLRHDLSPSRVQVNLNNCQEANWQARACRSENCPARRRCPFHSLSDVQAAMDLNIAIEGLVADLCLAESQFVGRSSCSTSYENLFSRLELAEDHPIRTHMQSLQLRGFVVGYLWGDGDGIQGWLDSDETRALGSALSELHLPNYPATFDAMQELYESEDSGEWHWDEISLSFVRTTALIASKQGKGILWGDGIIADQ